MNLCRGALVCFCLVASIANGCFAQSANGMASWRILHV